MPDIRQLRYFVAVAEEKHFGRAAERLHLSQPPLSQQIRHLENELGTQLLDRTTRHVDTTAAGAMLLHRARRLLRDMDQLVADVRKIGEGSTGVLRVGFSGSASYRLMPAVMQLMRAELPGVHLHIMGDLLTPDMETALTEGRLDIAVLRPPIDSPEVELEPFKQDRLMVALPPGHPLAERPDELSVEDLAGQDFVFFPLQSSVATLTAELCRTAGFRPHVASEAGETSTLLGMVRAGIGLAVVPETAHGPSADGLVYRPLHAAPTISLALAWHRSNSSALITSFRDIVHRATAELLKTSNVHSPENP